MMTNCHTPLVAVVVVEYMPSLLTAYLWLLSKKKQNVLPSFKAGRQPLVTSGLKNTQYACVYDCGITMPVFEVKVTPCKFQNITPL